MIFIGTVKGIGYALLILLCMVVLMYILIKNFRFRDEALPLLLLSVCISAVLMSIYCTIKGSESRVLYAQAKVNSAILQMQEVGDRESVMNYIDENLPDFSSEQQSGQYSDLSSQVDNHANSVVRGLRIARYITLSIEVIIQFLIFVLVANKFKYARNYGRRVDYSKRDYYD